MMPHPTSTPLAFYVLSAEQAGAPPLVNARRTAHLRKRLDRDLPGWWKPARGHTAQWGDEASAIVFVPRGGGATVHDWMLGWKAYYKQEAILYVSSTRVAYLLTGASGSRSRLGQWRGVSGDVACWTGTTVPTGDYTFTPRDGAYYRIVPDKSANDDAERQARLYVARVNPGVPWELEEVKP